MNPIIDVRGLRVRKQGKTICRISRLEVAAGERVGILGSNGSGKTTLLRILGGLEAEYEGQCHAPSGRHDRVYVHQNPYLFRETVAGNVAYGLTGRGLPRSEQRATAVDWLKRLGVDHLADRSCADLSAGERRRVALARAFAIRPAVLLLDEPFADLDEDGCDLVCRAMGELSDSTFLIASPIPLPKMCQARIVRVTTS